MIRTSISAIMLLTGSVLFGGPSTSHVEKHLEISSTTVMTTTTTIPPGLAKWNTVASDPTATWLDSTDPMWNEPLKVQIAFACVRYHESRNHLVDTTRSSGAEGWYMFIPEIWKFARANIPGLPVHPNDATGDQQSTVALWFYHRNGSLKPEWSLDAC